jgi:hypothetical protein
VRFVDGRAAGVRLNDSQRRALSITLRLLEERVTTIRDLLNCEESGALYRRPRPQFSGEQTGQVEASLDQIDDEIRRAALIFGLPTEERDTRGTIAALLAMSWQNLGEIDSRGMRAYGETDPGLEGELDPMIRRLMDLVVGLEATVARSR